MGSARECVGVPSVRVGVLSRDDLLGLVAIVRFVITACFLPLGSVKVVSLFPLSKDGVLLLAGMASPSRSLGVAVRSLLSDAFLAETAVCVFVVNDAVASPRSIPRRSVFLRPEAVPNNIT